MRKELLPGEQVIVVTRPQPRTLIVPALLFILVPALAAYASAWIVKGGPARLVPLIKESDQGVDSVADRGVHCDWRPGCCWATACRGS